MKTKGKLITGDEYVPILDYETVICDLDGVVYDFIGSFQSYLEEQYFPVAPTVQGDIWKFWENHPQQWSSEDDFSRELFNYYADPVSQSVQHFLDKKSRPILSLLVKANLLSKGLYVSTARPDGACEDIIKYINLSTDVEFDYVFHSMRSGEKRFAVNHMMGNVLAIEDSPDEIEGYLDMGVDVLMPVYNYNKHLLETKETT